MSIFIGTRVPNTTGGASESFRQTGHHTYATSGDGVGYKLAFDQKIRYINGGLPVVVTMSAATPAYVWQGSFGGSESTAKKDWNPVESKWVAFCALSGGQIYLAHEADIPDIGAVNDIVATDLIHHFDGWHQYQPKIPVVVTPDSSILVYQGGAGVNDSGIQLETFNGGIASLGTLHSGHGYGYEWPGSGGFCFNFGLAACSQNRIASDLAGNVMLIDDISGRLLLGSVPQTPDLFTDVTDNTYTSTGTAIHGTYERQTCVGINCDGTTWWALICQAVGTSSVGFDITDWRMDVYSSIDGITWVHERLVQHLWPNTRTAVGIGEAGQVLIIDGLPAHPDTGVPFDPLVYSVATGSATPIVLDTTSTDYRHLLGYNLFLVLADGFHQHNYAYFPYGIELSGTYASLYAPVRFCAGPNGPIWFGGPNIPADIGIFTYELDYEPQVQTLVDMTGAWEDRPLCIAMDDGAGGLYAVDDTTGDFIHRPGPAGTAWVTLIAAVHPASEECVFMQFSRKHPGQIVLVHGLGGVARSTYIDDTTFAVLETDTFALSLVDTAYGFGDTSGSVLFTTFSCLAEPAP